MRFIFESKTLKSDFLEACRSIIIFSVSKSGIFEMNFDDLLTDVTQKILAAFDADLARKLSICQHAK